MSQGATTPEELETLLEDAFVVRDGEALRRLFEDGAVLATGSGAELARGCEAIERYASALWQRGRTYVAEPRHVLQARDTALVVGDPGVRVVRRGGGGAWRYAISLLDFNHTVTEEDR